MDRGLPGERRRPDGPKSDALLDRADVQRDLELAQSLGLTLAQFDALPESERPLWIARHHRKRGTCPDCGRPVEECSDPKRDWFPFRRICYATMAQAAAQEMYKALHEQMPYHDGSFTNWAKSRSADHPHHFEAGVTIGVADEDLMPWDKFTSKIEASPLPPDESPGKGADARDPASD